MKDYSRLATYCATNRLECRRNVPLRDCCTFKIGGAADLLVQPDGEETIRGILTIAEEAKLPVLILGKGSNMLFSDDGYRGVVLQLGTAFSSIRLVDDTTVDCDSGASLIQLCRFALDKGLSGLEFAYGIPGSVGGAIYMNAGAYGGEMKDVLVSTRHVCPDGTAGSLMGEGMGLSYRHSAYSESDRVITGGVFKLQKGNRPDIQARMEDYMNRRRTKQPLEYPSAGSTFKRPEGAFASALIDQCGLKGRRVGGAVVSEKHAGFVINAGEATGADVRALIALVQREVQKKTGYKLACEVKMID